MLKMDEYRYNTDRINEVCQAYSLSAYQVMKDLNTGNQMTPRRWMEGRDITVTRLIDFCNKYKQDILSFFRVGDKLLSEYIQDKNGTEIITQKDQLVDERISHIREIAEIEKKHIQELAKKDIENANKISELKDNIRELVKLEFEKDKEKMMTKYEEQLAKKEQDIALLREQLITLQAQYKELEMSTGNPIINMPLSSTGVAEGKTKPYR